LSTPAFSPALGGLFKPIGRLRGFGVNSETALPYDLGASASGDGGGDGASGVAVGDGAGGAPFSARRQYETVKDRH